MGIQFQFSPTVVALPKRQVKLLVIAVTVNSFDLTVKSVKLRLEAEPKNFMIVELILVEVLVAYSRLSRF